MVDNHFTGRQDFVKILESVLQGTATKGKLTIQTIEGPGGIGKSYLLDHVMQNSGLATRQYITLSVNGNKGFPRSLASCIDELIMFADGVPLKQKPAKHYFEQTNNVIDALNGLVNDVEKKAGQLNINIQAIRDVIEFILQASSKIPPVIPGIDPSKWQDYYNKLNPVIDQIDGTGISFSVPDWMIPGRTLRNLLKQNSCIPLAQALTTDLTTILHGYPKTDWYKPALPKLNGTDRLLVIIDDYESLKYPMGEFLTQYFLPALSAAPFESLVIIVCRDRVEATSPAWSQNLKSNMLPRIDVTPFSRDELDSLVESYDYQSSDEKDRAWQDTQGYPYLVQLWIEEAREGGRSVSTLQMFHERTTRWMNDTEKEWLDYLIFLDQVNIRTLRAILPEGVGPNVVMDWFQKEGSIRDPFAAKYQVREFIRSRLCEYIECIDPDRYEELKLRGSNVMKLQS